MAAERHGHEEPDRLSPADEYKLGEFAARYRLETSEARRIMDEQGCSRERLDAYMATRVAE
jgi:hypothetical protein